MEFILIAGACVVKNDKILLLQIKKANEQDGRWGPPSGHANGIENPEDVALRETKEETGLDVKLTDLVQIAISYYKNQAYLFVFYKAKIIGHQKIKIQNEEVYQYKWVNLEDIQNNKFIFRKRHLKDLMIRALTNKTSPKGIINHLEIERD